jgi:MFS transporter, PAT family, beta-lactamase induction signal transducer AmpG
MSTKALFASPWVFVPVLYIVFGLGQGGIIGGMTAVLYKDLGYSNAFIGMLALLALPGSFIFLIAPYLDAWSSKRALIWKLFIGLGFSALFLSLAMFLDEFFTVVTLSLFLLMSFFFACVAVVSNGFYQRVLILADQAKFSGIMSASIRAGTIFGLILFVRIGADINLSASAGTDQPATIGWTVVLAGAAIAFWLGAAYCAFLLPRPVDDKPVSFVGRFPVWDVLKEYFQMKRVWAIVALILFYRFGQGMQFQMTAPFYMDTIEDGGMGVTASTVAMLKTYTDVPWMTIGGILGGFLIARFGLRYTFLPLALLLNIPNLGYIYLAWAQPTGTFTILGDTFPTVLFIVSCVESFGYGMGFAPFMFFMYAIAKGPYKTSLLMISISIMGMGFHFPGAMAGFLQQATGYVSMFSIATVIGFSALLLLFFVPLPNIKSKAEV